MMKICRICNSRFDPTLPPTEPAEEAGLFLAQEKYGDAGQLCLACLAARGRLAMMYGGEGE